MHSCGATGYPDRTRAVLLGLQAMQPEGEFLHLLHPYLPGSPGTIWTVGAQARHSAAATDMRILRSVTSGLQDLSLRRTDTNSWYAVLRFAAGGAHAAGINDAATGIGATRAGGAAPDGPEAAGLVSGRSAPGIRAASTAAPDRAAVGGTVPSSAGAALGRPAPTGTTPDGPDLGGVSLGIAAASVAAPGIGDAPSGPEATTDNAAAAGIALGGPDASGDAQGNPASRAARRLSPRHAFDQRRLMSCACSCNPRFA